MANLSDIFKRKKQQVDAVQSQLESGVGKVKDNVVKFNGGVDTFQAPKERSTSPFSINLTDRSQPFVSLNHDWFGDNNKKEERTPLVSFNFSDPTKPLISVDKDRLKYEPYVSPKGSLSERSRRRDGDYFSRPQFQNPEQILYNDTYYRILDDPTHTKMYTGLEKYFTGRGGAVDHTKAEDFRAQYKSDRAKLDAEYERVKEEYGKDSIKTRALKQFIDDYEQLGKELESSFAISTSDYYAQAADSQIKAIYGDVFERPDFREKVSSVRDDDDMFWLLAGPELTNFVSGGGAPQSAQDLVYYLYATEGKDAALKFVRSELGKAATAANAYNEYGLATTSTGDPVLDALSASVSMLTTLTRGHLFNAITEPPKFIKGLIGADKDDPDDKQLAIGYTISDSTDSYLKSMVDAGLKEAGVSDEQFKQIADAGFSQLGQMVGSEAWYKEAKDASDYQKQFLGYIFLSTNFDPEATKVVWESIKEHEKNLWDLTKAGSNVSSIGEETRMTEQLENEYLGLAGTKLPGFFKDVGEGATLEQFLHHGAGSAIEQILPWMLGSFVGEFAGGLGASSKAASAWANRASSFSMGTMIGGRAYAEALDRGASRETALLYGIWNGAEEFITDRFLDGAGAGLSKVTGSAVEKAMAKISDPVLKALASAGIRAGGEAAQEYIQEAGEPIKNYIFFHEGDWKDAFLGEGDTVPEQVLDALLDPDRLYAASLGGLTSLMMSPGNTLSDIRSNFSYRDLGSSMSKVGAIDTAVDLILSNPADVDPEAYEEAKKTAELIKGGTKVSDQAKGEMIANFVRAGGDISILTNPDTMVYNKDALTIEDYIAGAKSMLVSLEGDVELAEDVAKLAMGEAISEEAQAKINESEQAKTVLEQFKGDLDMSDNDSALTRAARASIIRGALETKVFTLLQHENPDKKVVTPATQQLIDSGVKLDTAEKVGTVIDKVLNGEEITEDEAKLVKASSPAIRATVLDTLGIELSEYANTATVMSQLNEQAAEVASVKEQQAAVKAAAKDAAKARGAAMQGGITNGIQGNDTRSAVQSEKRSGQERPQDSGAAAGSPAAAGQAPADLGRSGQRPGSGQRNAGEVHPEVTEEQKQDVERKCVASGADTVDFVENEDSCTFYDPERGYVIKIKTNGQFTIDQYGEHEPIHLWVTHALSEDHRWEVLNDFGQQFTERFGDEFYNKLYSFVEKVYGAKGYLPSDEDAAMYQILEDMLAFCYAGQNYGMDLTACRQFARQFVEDHGLRAIGTGDMSNPKVQEALAKGWIDQEYYRRHGYGQTDTTEIDLGLGEDTSAAEDIDEEEFGKVFKQFRGATSEETTTPAEETTTPAEETATPAEKTEEEKTRQRILDRVQLDNLKKLRKNLAAERRRRVKHAADTNTQNDPAHREQINALNEQIKELDQRITDLEGAQYSADYDPELIRSIGLIAPDGQTAAFTDNINGVHEEILNQINGNQDEDVKDFIARGGIRVKPNSGIEINGDIEPTLDQYELVEQVVDSFTGKNFSIDFNIDGVSAGTHTFEGADLDPSRVYAYLRNYYARRKADIARDERLKKYREVLGMPVKTMEDAYRAARFLMQQDEDNPDLQEIIDVYEGGRYSADYANPDSPDYLGPDIDSYTQARAIDEDIHRNLDNWGEEAAEKEVDEDAIDTETSLDEDLLESQLDAIMAEIATLPEDDPRVSELWDRYMALQDQGKIKTKAVDTAEESTPKKATKKTSGKKASTPKTKKSPAAQAFKPKAEPKKAEPVDERTAFINQIEQVQNELAENPELENDPEFQMRFAELGKRFLDFQQQAAEMAARLEAAADATRSPAARAFLPAPTSTALSTVAPAVETSAETATETAEPAPEAKAEPKEKPTVLKDKETKYSKKDTKGEWYKKIGRADTIEIRRLRSDRNTFDVRVTDSKGKVFTYNDVSPSALTKAFAFKTGDRATANARAERAMDLANRAGLDWRTYDNPEPARISTDVKPVVERAKDNQGREVAAKLSKYMENSAIRNDKGELITVYRLAPENGVHNAKRPGMVSLFSERAATMNTQRGMRGAEAYGQSGKSAGEDISNILEELKNPKLSKGKIEALRKRIANIEAENVSYVNGITQLDPWRPGFQFARRENIVNGKSLLEGYLDIRKPKVIDAQGKGIDFIKEEVLKFIKDPANKAGIFDANKNPVGPHDGFKFLNANILPDGESLGGGQLDLDTVYVTFRNNQAKSTYNTAPTNDDLMQYSADYTNLAGLMEVLDKARSKQYAMDTEKTAVSKGILETREGGRKDAKGYWISDGQYDYFIDAKYVDEKGRLKFGIIPLYRGSNRLTLLWNPDRSGKVRAMFFSTNPASSETYVDKGENTHPGYGENQVADLMEFERAVETIAKNIEWYEVQDLIDLRPWETARYEALNNDSPFMAWTYAEELVGLYNASLDDNHRLRGKAELVRNKNPKNAMWVQAFNLMRDKLTRAVNDLEYSADPESAPHMVDPIYWYTNEVLNKVLSVVDAAADNISREKAVTKESLEGVVGDAIDEVLDQPLVDTVTGKVLSYDIASALQEIRNHIESYEQPEMPEMVRYEDGSTSTLEELPEFVPERYIRMYYLDTSDPFVVDGGHKNWTKIDMSKHPDFLAWKKAHPEKLNTDPNHKTDPNSVYGTTDDIVQYAYDKHYNSVIIRDIWDGADTTADNDYGFGDVYVVFDSNQAKSVNNRNPSKDPRHNHSADYVGFDTGYTEGTLEDTILKILHDKDEDRAVAALAEYVAQFMQTGVLPEIENEKTRGIFNPKVTNAQAKAIEAQLKENIKKYGTLEKGENPARDVSFPRRTDEGYSRGTYRTAAESPNTPEWTLDALKREFLLDGTYERITDKAAIAYADREMAKKGYDAVRAQWEGVLDLDTIPMKDAKKFVALGETLFNEAVKVNDMETAMKTLAELAEVGTAAGQAVQAFRMLKKMPKSYQLYYFQRVVNRLNRQYSKRINSPSNKMQEIKIDKDLSRAVLQAKTREDLDKAVEALIQNIADQIPATTADKWNAWRYLAMLGNPKTHIRNMLGNAIFTPAKFAKDLIAAGIEGVIIRDPSQRRTSLKGLLDRAGTADYRAFAEKDFEGIKDELQSGGKYNPVNEVMSRRKIFKMGWLEGLRNFNGKALEAEDAWFLKKHYVNAMTNFLATRGMSVAELNRASKESTKLLNEARAYAFNEAQKATYRDASAVASALNNLKRAPGIGILMEGLLPFTKTPINILKRGIEYSPIGLLDAATRQAVKLHNGEITANDFIDSLASGLTGTGIAFLGFWLASMGLLKGGDDDDDKKADFDKLLGYQNYSINIGGTNYTIDWMAPTALPLFVGAAVYDEMEDKNGLSFADYYNALTVIAEPITQLSMLSGLNDTLKSAKWDDNPTSSIIQSMASGYITQALPTFLAQIARSIPENRRTTYVDKNSDVPQPIQRWFQTNVLGKIPGMNDKRPEYIDAWGRNDTTQSLALRLFDNILSPGYRNEINVTPVDQELLRLSEEVGTSLLMAPAERYIEFNHEKHDLTAEQYQTYARVRGTTTFDMLGELFNSEGYQNMTDEEKARAVDLIKGYGNILGKQAVFPEYESDDDNWAEKCDGDTTRLMNMAMLKAQAGAMGIKSGNYGEFYGLILSSNWLSPIDQGYAIAQQYDIGSSNTVYIRKNGPKWEITPERKEVLYQNYRQIFPQYYLQMVATPEWRAADRETRLEMLKDLRTEVNAINKTWLATTLQAQGAPVYTGK